MGQVHHVELDLEQLSAGDLWAQKDKLAKREAYLRAAWHEFEATVKPEERDSLLAVVRSTLIRLAETDNWLPGAVSFSKGRIDLHIGIDLTVADALVHMGPTSLAQAEAKVRVHLENLAARLEAMAEEPQAPPDAKESEVRVPFSSEQVESLNGFQRSGVMHEFTCGVGGHSHGPLRATTDGWVCDFEDCDYTQDWAHAFMADGSWRAARDSLREMGFSVGD